MQKIMQLIVLLLLPTSLVKFFRYGKRNFFEYYLDNNTHKISRTGKLITEQLQQVLSRRRIFNARFSMKTFGWNKTFIRPLIPRPFSGAYAIFEHTRKPLLHIRLNVVQLVSYCFSSFLPRSPTYFTLRYMDFSMKQIETILMNK